MSEGPMMNASRAAVFLIRSSEPQIRGGGPACLANVLKSPARPIPFLSCPSVVLVSECPTKWMTRTNQPQYIEIGLKIYFKINCYIRQLGALLFPFQDHSRRNREEIGPNTTPGHSRTQNNRIPQCQGQPLNCQYHSLICTMKKQLMLSLYPFLCHPGEIADQDYQSGGYSLSSSLLSVCHVMSCHVISFHLRRGSLACSQYLCTFIIFHEALAHLN